MSKRTAPAFVPAAIEANTAEKGAPSGAAWLLKSVKAHAEESTAGATPTVPAQIHENSDWLMLWLAITPSSSGSVGSGSMPGARQAGSAPVVHDPVVCVWRGRPVSGSTWREYWNSSD